MSGKTYTLKFVVDQLDYDAIVDALAIKQVAARVDNRLSLPPGAEDLAGRLLGEIARDYVLPWSRIA
jgi:hypothetical protein